jgi:hypothetical protein
MRTAQRTSVARRYLVLTDEAARHPFRASLPPHVRAPLSDEAPEEQRNWRLSRRDWRDFFGTWFAGFAVVTMFIA